MALTLGQQRLYSGDYNYLFQEWQSDGSVIITISGGESRRTHRVHIKNLWGKEEEVLSEEEVTPGPPAWMKKRLKAARKVK